MSERLQQLIGFLAESPSDPFLKYALATEYLKLGQVDNALRYYEELLDKHPDYVGTYYHLAKLYEALERKADAIAVYEKGMQAAESKRDLHALSELRAAFHAATSMEDGDDE
ncbi:Tetratricopeptide repeat-containing protein [Parapedobacter luteus]|uniref:Tetratricopeptide repeat-containing protein n=1 Tax=Parapedobacter luteus TaxID=623280 RepID=A0A1T5B2R9_9SPHI|nr:tetratricopeptide repeat protein [Parapedobacter luteus]SKB41270.1 Tetratricopeptide repeat-containing protein [Parapedobacter luteus]